MAAIVVTPELMRNTASKLSQHIEHAQAIANQYLADHENILGAGTWDGAGSKASYATAAQIHEDMQKVLIGGTRLTEGLNQAAALMESHESHSEHAFHSLFGGQSA
ncbi:MULTISPECIES: WXG100 family type VII secretion target [Mycolicibacter]|jgi:WXG100 family type VII secretion target|uniref:Type VII secretion protein EsxD n=3 Tax=Mycolicibacter TaxID=1073531 RepID=A0A1A2EKH6_MYCSD|nr:MULTISPECIES: WXG100 family type VII secretion target [Mycolicibacter]MDD7812164.1 WXG100 family type VII secretion target [Mycobacterium sp. CSUR Q5927]MEB3020125.1 WXG100 family type VII secretion target [Mycolicibacter sp. MYC098]MEB3035007.1 WXG100 family type VII secretion target [Mycolicibacter sp. MYC340]OBG05647.1 type VII secretion protein EsxD [Mycolicibacter sinensis]OBG07774.1 type VII secretion protein EsxD [Mycolicibacter sinensis]